MGLETVKEEMRVPLPSVVQFKRFRRTGTQCLRDGGSERSPSLFKPHTGRVVRCLSREEAPNTFHGRVTDALPEVIDGTDLDPDQTDVYLCGSAAMVSDTHRFLGRAGYESIHTEPY